jgi:hypothetical protein
VGKGLKDRVFSHTRAQVGLDGDELDNKIKRIHQIRNAGFEVAHVIHRHGLEEKVAVEVEAALIDAYPGLTNVAGGAGSGDFGAMHAQEIVHRYAAEPAVFQHKAILISVNRSAAETSLYDAVRFAWKISPKKAEKAEVVLATMQGLIKGAFLVDRWLPATSANFPGKDENRERFGFIGREPLRLLRGYTWASVFPTSTESQALQTPSSIRGRADSPFRIHAFRIVFPSAAIGDICGQQPSVSHLPR